MEKLFHYTVSPERQARIERDFTYHAPFGSQAQRYAAIRDEARAFAYTLARLAPESRELSLAYTHLEQAVLFANAAIARNEEL